ncbi:Hypothetical_protein [Hexamita inflata]|uniref:Hypothetical_protein n=1 Tax=Hexamita inflata TaxID=28002 RepID=A0ABP1GFB6_9EUKA
MQKLSLSLTFEPRSVHFVSSQQIVVLGDNNIQAISINQIQLQPQQISQINDNIVASTVRGSGIVYATQSGKIYSSGQLQADIGQQISKVFCVDNQIYFSVQKSLFQVIDGMPRKLLQADHTIKSMLQSNNKFIVLTTQELLEFSADFSLLKTKKSEDQLQHISGNCIFGLKNVYDFSLQPIMENRNGIALGDELITREMIKRTKFSFISGYDKFGRQEAVIDSIQWQLVVFVE